MAGDGLHDPLGTNRKVDGSLLRSSPVRVLAVVFVLTLAGLGFLAARDDTGRGGEPFAIASIDRMSAPPTTVAPARSDTARTTASSPAAGPAPDAAADLTGSTVRQPPRRERRLRERRQGGQGDGRKGAGLPDAACAAGACRCGPSTRSRPDRTHRVRAASQAWTGRRPTGRCLWAPLRFPGRPTSDCCPGRRHGSRPCRNRAGRRALPPGVTLAFAPAATGLDQQVEQARAAGHEVVLQLPMVGGGADPSSTHALTTEEYAHGPTGARCGRGPNARVCGYGIEYRPRR